MGHTSIPDIAPDGAIVAALQRAEHQLLDVEIYFADVSAECRRHAAETSWTDPLWFSDFRASLAQVEIARRWRRRKRRAYDLAFVAAVTGLLP